MMTKKLFSVLCLMLLVTFYFLLTVINAHAADMCEITIEATDTMAFSTKAIDVPKTCKAFTVNLKHMGKLSKNIMGHNWVLTKASEQQRVLDDGMKAGAAAEYLKSNDQRVIASTKLIGGGETTSAKFAVGKLSANESYVFFCSFPGHASMMKGTLKLI